uniref:Uncharacterized protein n=1 Tax=Rhizophora mucronata TaxID=61149 RepID=A0A2P2QN50_RHIMU
MVNWTSPSTMREL